MEHETFYLDTGNDRVYFNVIDGTLSATARLPPSPTAS